MASGFDDIFKEQEYRFLLGDKKKGLYLLTAILFLTFFALGHILGGQKELNKRMSNPFTNWINVPVLSSNSAGIDLMEDETDDTNFLDSFHISSVIPYEITWFKGLERDFGRTRKLTVRSINENDPLLNVVLDPNNIIDISSQDRNSSCDLIITESALNLLDFDISEGNYILPIYDNEYSDDHLTILMSVSHIVRELPSDVDVVISDKMMRLLNSNAEKSGYIDQGDRATFTFVSTKSISEDQFEQYIPDTLIVEEYSVQKDLLNGERTFIHKLEFRNDIPFSDYRQIQKDWHLNGLYSIIEIDCAAKPDVHLNPYYYALNFKELSMVKSFRSHAKENYDLILSLAQVESRDNFYLISRLTSLLIVLLVVLSGFSIVLYLQNIVSNHLEKIKPNLGTLKAFGLSNEKISDLYIRIVSKFYVVASVIAILFLALYKFMQMFLSIELHFRLFDLKLVIIWVAIYLMLYFLFKRLISRILFRSPGDLIYNR